MAGSLFDDPLDLAGRLGIALDARAIETHMNACAQLKARVTARETELIQNMLRSVRMFERSVTVEIDTAALASALGHKIVPDRPSLVLTSDATLQKSGRVLKLVNSTSVPVQPSVDPSLVRLIARAHRWWRMLRTGEINVAGLAAREGVTRSYLTRVVRLAFLSPKSTFAILEGRIPANVTPSLLKSPDAIALSWTEQQAKLLG